MFEGLLMATNRFISHIVPCLFDENCNIAATVESWPNNSFNFVLSPHSNIKSVQSALSDLKRPLERLQSQCNYRPFINAISLMHLNATLSETKLRPNLPKRNGQW